MTNSGRNRRERSSGAIIPRAGGHPRASRHPRPGATIPRAAAKAYLDSTNSRRAEARTMRRSVSVM